MNPRLIPLLLLCLVPACGGGSDPRALTDAGSKALNAGQYQDAADSYTKALAAIGTDTANPEWKRAQLGLVQAHARIDGARAKTEFLELAKGNPSKITDADYNLIASKLGDAGKLNEAIEVLKAGSAAFPESPHLDALGKDLVNRAKASGNSGALDALKGLGYVGDE